MFKCADPTIRYLQDSGFNVIRVPRADLRPGDALAGQGPRLFRVAHVTEIWKSPDRELPAATVAAAANLDGRTTRAFKLPVAVSLLGSLLAPLGFSLPKLEAALQRTKSVSFGFGSPQVQSITPYALGEYLQHLNTPASNPAVDRFIMDGSHDTHLLTDVLTSSSMTMTVGHDTATESVVDVSVLHSSVGASVQVVSKSASETVVEFSGSEQLAFGFRALEFEVEEGQVKFRSFTKPGSVLGASQAPPRDWASIFPLAEVTVESPPSDMRPGM